MRWQELFADLEGEARSLERAEQDSEVAERTRAEIGQIALANRLRAQVAQPVTLLVRGSREVSGDVQRVGADWVLLSSPHDELVPLLAISAVVNLPPSAVTTDGVGVVAGRVTLSAVLRALARDRSGVSVWMWDGGHIAGTPDRVGLDHLDLAVHDLDGAPRRSEVRTRMTVAFAAISLVRRRDSGWS